MKKRFQQTKVTINGEQLHTIIDQESGQYCAVTYRYEIDAILEADFLNAADAKLSSMGAATEQRKGRANQGRLDTRDDLSRWTDDIYNAQS
jgi:hypothetical protein